MEVSVGSETLSRVVNTNENVFAETALNGRIIFVPSEKILNCFTFPPSQIHRGLKS